MVVEIDIDETNSHEKCSGIGEHVDCWPSECIKTPLQTAPRDTIIKQGAVAYMDEDLRQAMKLSVREEHETQEQENADTKNLKKAMQLSLLEAAGAGEEASAMNSDERKQLEMAIMASIEDVSDEKVSGGRNTNGAKDKTLAWNPEERNAVQKLLLTDAPATIMGIESAMKAMEKPLRMWPELYALMKPIRELMSKPLSQQQWNSDHYIAWNKARDYMKKEMSFTNTDIDTDTDQEEGATDQVVPNTNIQPPEKKCIKQPGHPLCSLHLTRGASLDGPNLGLSERALTMLNITPPITTRVFISNLAYGVNEAKL